MLTLSAVSDLARLQPWQPAYFRRRLVSCTSSLPIQGTQTIFTIPLRSPSRQHSIFWPAKASDAEDYPLSSLGLEI